MRNLNLTTVMLCLLFVYSCREEKKANIAIMESAIQKQMKDNSFRDNVDLKIFELKVIDYDTINSYDMDTFRFIHYVNTLSNYNDICTAIKKTLVAKYNIASLEKQMYENKTINDIHQSDLKDKLNELNQMLDSADRYNKLSEKLGSTLGKERQAFDLYFRAKVFIKATSTKEGQSTNYMDTSAVYFNEKAELFNPF